MGFNAKDERIEDKDFTVRLPVDESAFNSWPRSEAIRKKGNSGLAFINTVTKVRRHGPGKSDTLAPPRYIEVFPPSAPLEPIAEDMV